MSGGWLERESVVEMMIEEEEKFEADDDEKEEGGDVDLGIEVER